jgi:NAD(P)-dependent dehydrogenase (short-subunit alcohol dehydrogenase family)
MTDKPLANRLALVTGASRGIGRATALALSDLGAHVIACARRRSGLEDLDDEIHARGGTATLIQFDLKDRERINVLGPTLFERWGKLDILIGNAGILGPLSPLNHVSETDWDDVFAINVTANWLLLRTLDPLLRASDAGRVVLLTSGAASAKRAYWGPYSVSKAALEALAKTYAHETVKSPVKVNMVNPGPMRTEMRKKAFPGENPDSLPAPEEITPLIAKLADPAFQETGQRFDFADFK